ncbi:MAG: M20/M25/M40 family metallo-hydrolase [Gemmatimonadota bacterium]
MIISHLVPAEWPESDRVRDFLLPVLLLAVMGASCGPAAVETPAPPTAAVEASLLEVAESSITAEKTFESLSFLAADDMLGRDTPSPELERAAEYLADQLGELQLEPAGDEGSFVQRWPFERLVLDAEESRARVEVGGETRDWRYSREYFAIPSPPVLVEGTPVYAPTAQAVTMGLPAEAAGQPLVVGLPDGLGPDFAMAIQGGMQAQVAGIILVMDEGTDEAAVHQIAQALEGGAAGEMPLPVMGLAYEAGRDFLAAAGVDPDGAGGPGAQVLEGVRVEFSFAFDPTVDQVPNVAGLLRGSDPALADEYVVLTAHFDHVGVGPPDATGDSIYSGADDNASGTSAVLQVARAFTALPEAPARSVLFLFVSGEEKGLLGARHYAQNPTVPQEGLVANLNLDMVSRNHPDTVYGIGEEYTTIGRMAHEIVAEHPELGLVVAQDPEPEEQVFLRSDHFSFVQVGVPALMFTTWLHDDYHVPSDTSDRVDAEKAARVARLAFLLAHRIASDPARPEWTEEGRELLEGLGGMQ